MDKSKPRRLLTIGHSYVIGTNRRLPAEIQTASNGRWEATVVAPEHFEGNPRYGQLRPETLTIEKDEPVRVIGVPMRRTTRIHVTTYGKKLRDLMRRQKFDLVHVWQEPYILCGGQIAFWTPKSSALTFHSFQNINKSYPPPFSWIERYAMSRADGWVAAADKVLSALKDRPGYRDRPVRNIAVGVDTGLFKHDAAARARVLQEIGWTDDGTVTIGYLGRLTEAKGLPLLMSALDRIELPWRALFVGSGELEETIKTWGARYGDRFRHVPNVPAESVPAYVNAFDVLCAPSQTTPIWREQFGRMLIEGFACGVPVLASDSGEIPNVVGDAGTIVGEKDLDGWVKALNDLISSPGLRDDLSKRGMRRVLERFTWSTIGAQYVDFFDEILAKRGKGGAGSTS